MCNVKVLTIYIYSYIRIYKLNVLVNVYDAVIAQCGGDGGGGRLINRDRQRFRTIS